jgi:glycogen synthase
MPDTTWQSSLLEERKNNAWWIATLRLAGVSIMLVLSAWQALVIGLSDWQATLPILAINGLITTCGATSARKCRKRRARIAHDYLIV